MMNDATYTRKLPCGGTLRVWATHWDIYYYFPGPDRRYKGTIVSIPGGRIDEYIAAYQKSWNDFEHMRANKPSMGELRKKGSLGMSIGVGGYYEGVFIDSCHMPISEKYQLDRLLRSFGEAKALAATTQEALFPALLTSNNSVAEKSILSQSQDAAGKEDETENSMAKRMKNIAPKQRRRKSHLAEAINAGSSGWQAFWSVVICIAIVVCFVLAISGPK